MIDLASDALRVSLDPARGGVIRSAAAGPTELLYRAHWPVAPIEFAGRGESAWTKAWGGGWNILFPNAGAPCELDGHAHPFHGSASIAAWTVVDHSGCEARLLWQAGDGLRVERAVAVDGAVLRAESVVSNDGPAPRSYVLVEHLVLGAELLGQATGVQLSHARVVPLADEGPPLTGDSSPWPRVWRGAEEEDWSRRPSEPASRFGALHDVGDRSLIVSAPERGLDVRLNWSETFPFLWFWEERTGYETSPWDRQAVCLGLEPSTTSTGEGLAAARARGEAPPLEPGARRSYRVELEVAR